MATRHPLILSLCAVLALFHAASLVAAGRNVPQKVRGTTKKGKQRTKRKPPNDSAMSPLERRISELMASHGTSGTSVLRAHKAARRYGDLVQHYQARRQIQEVAWWLGKRGGHKQASALEQDIARHLRKAEVVPGSRKPFHIATSESVRLNLVGGMQAVWKPENGHEWATRVRHEVIAYKISRALGLAVVPVTVRRKIDGVWGSLQYYCDGTVSGGKASVLPSQRIRLLDFLIDGQDRSESNYRVQDGIYQVAIDHAVSFGVRGRLSAPALRQLSRPREDIVEALHSMTREDWFALIGSDLRAEFRTIKQTLRQRGASAESHQGIWHFRDVKERDHAFNAFMDRVDAAKRAWSL